MKLELIEGLVLAAILLNILVSIFLILRNDLGKPQKTAQIIMVWLFPFIAAIGLWLFNRSHDGMGHKYKKAFGGGANDSIGVLPPGEGGGSGD